jgi:vitamin B12 transporter
MKNTITLAIICSCFFHSFAQIDTSGVYSDVVIEEKRLTQLPFQQSTRNVQIITREEIKAMPAQSIAEVLTWVAGVDLRQRSSQGGQADLSILGSTFEQALVLIDGVPMRDAQTGHLMMNLPVDIEQVERIEIIKGTASRIYGANALAGAINIVTRAPASDYAVAQLWMGSTESLEGDSVKNYLQSGLRYASAWRNKTATQRHQIEGALIASDGHRYNSALDQNRIGYRGRMIVGKRKSQIDIASGYLSNEVGANGFYAYPFDVDAFEKTESMYASVQGRVTLGKWNLHPIAYMRYSEDDYIFVKENPSIYRNQHFSTAAGAELHVSKLNRYGQFGGGYEARAEEIHSNNLGHHSRYFHSFYGEQRMMFENSAVVVVGAMVQYSNVYGTNVYPGIEFNTPLVRSLRLYGSAGLGSRNPSFTDLYYSDRANMGNRSLKPEQAFNSELGLKWNEGILRVESGGFIRRTSNFIDFTRETAEDAWMPENFQLVSMAGVDSRAIVQLKSEAPIALEQVGVSHTFLSGSLGESVEFSKYALNNLRHQFLARAQVRLQSHFRLQLISRYIERLNSGSYWVYDLRASAAVNKMDVAIDVNNLANQAYIESGFVPMPGRLLRLSLTWRLNEESMKK